MYHYNLRL